METNLLNLSLDNLIMVDEPYNILEDVIVKEDGSLVAKVRNEYLMEGESGPMQCSEFGRHIAVLGSMLLAKNNPSKEKHYYLAGTADLRRSHLRIYENDVFWLRASVMEQNRRGGKVFGEMVDINGDELYTGEVDYKILKGSMFERLYAHGKVDDSPINDISPYQSRKKLRNVYVDEDKISAIYGVVSAAECQGHFNNYPCLPAAVVGCLFGELALNLLQHVTGFTKMVDQSAIVKAKRLTFAGEFVRFEGKLLEQKSDNTIVMFAEAFVGDEVIAEVTTEVVGVY